MGAACCARLVQTHNFSHRSSLMRRTILLLLFLISSTASLHAQQTLCVQWEALTAADFTHAIEQSQLQKSHDYVVYIQSGERHIAQHPLKTDKLDMHAGQSETSNTMISRPDLVHLDRAKQESGADQKHDPLPETVYTGIWWYARFPEHYSGDGSIASKELGEAGMNNWIATIEDAIRAVQADHASLKLQNEFYEKSHHPLDTT